MLKVINKSGLNGWGFVALKHMSVNAEVVHMQNTHMAIHLNISVFAVLRQTVNLQIIAFVHIEEPFSLRPGVPQDGGVKRTLLLPEHFLNFFLHLRELTIRSLRQAKLLN
jgi:hypothetical protein